MSQLLNDRCSAIAQSWAKTTFSHSSPNASSISDFAHSLITPSGSIAVTSDGIGTKAEIAERMMTYDTVGFDLVAMVADDLAASNARPVAISNILDVNRFDEEAIDALMRGLAAASRTAGIVMSGGEIAQLGTRVHGVGDGMHFNWCATAIGVPIGRIGTANRAPRPGDCLIALASDGFRSNGYTLARSILQAQLGLEWHSASTSSGSSWGERLLTPSRIYAPVMAALTAAEVPVISAVHVTGGGIPGNLPRILRGDGLGARLDDLWPPHPGMCELIQMMELNPEQAYENWNMGNGFLIVVSPETAATVVSIARDQDVQAKVAGEIVLDSETRIDARGWDMGRLAFGGVS